MIGKQLPLPSIINGLATSKNSIGIFGEMWLIDRLLKQGFKVAANHKFQRGDIQVFVKGRKSFFIEIKTARQGASGDFKFTLVKHDKYGSTDHRNTDFTVLLCITKAYAVIPFVIQTSAIQNRRAIKITTNARTYAGKYAQYRQTISKLTFQMETIQ